MVAIIGHRGARAHLPENTLCAFALALKQGVDCIDMDVVATSDKQFVVYHNLTLDPDILRLPNEKELLSTDLPLPANKLQQMLMQRFDVQSMPLKQMQSYRVWLDRSSDYAKFFSLQQQPCLHDNNAVSSLEDVVLWFNQIASKQICLQIEIKNSFTNIQDAKYTPQELADMIYDLILKHNLIDRVKIQAFDWLVLYYLNQLNSKIKTAYLLSYEFFVNFELYHAYYKNTLVGVILNKHLSSVSLKSLPVDILAAINAHLDSSQATHIFLKANKDNKDALVKLAIIATIKELGGYSYEVEDACLNKFELDYAHQLGLRVYVWPWPEHSLRAFDKDLMNKLISWQIDGIITDDPLLLRQCMQQLENSK